MTDIKIHADQRLKLSRDRKVSPLGRDGGERRRLNGKKMDRGKVATINNSFGLPSGTTCPGKTSFCKSCYATNSEVYFPNVGRAMRHNLAMLNLFEARFGTPGLIELLDEAVSRYERQADFYEFDRSIRVFRIHWDGDFYSYPYAVAWAEVIRRHPNVTFWCYTRSFSPDMDIVPVLAPLENLTLYLSVDADNCRAAHEVLRREPDVLVAACAVDYRTARELRNIARGSEPPLASVPCPENARVIPLNNADGVGACVTCGLCVRGNRDILFSTSHLEDVLHGQGELFPVPVTITRRDPHE